MSAGVPAIELFAWDLRRGDRIVYPHVGEQILTHDARPFGDGTRVTLATVGGGLTVPADRKVIVVERDASIESHSPAWTFDDGGRAESGYRGFAGDCVPRAIAIATGIPYREVYDELFRRARIAHARRRPSSKKVAALRRESLSPRDGTKRTAYEPYLLSLGWEWVPTMTIGSGTTVHLRADELPGGTIIARVSKHMTTLIDGVIHDTYDPSRDGTRAVYGYFQHPIQRDGEAASAVG